MCKKIKAIALEACENRLHAHLCDSGFRDPQTSPSDHRFKLHLQDEQNNEINNEETLNQTTTEGQT